MKGARWHWVSARSIGTSHLRVGAGCDDAGACLETVAAGEPVLIAAVSDGAGSAKLSSIGSRIVCDGFCRSAARTLRHRALRSLAFEEEVGIWLDDIRDRISARATQESALPRDFAATLVGAIVGRECALVAHIGDGACAYRLADETEWRIPSWPAQGEFAATTYFITDDPEPRLVLTPIAGSVEEIALFTDGLERLVLKFETQTAFAPFFEQMFSPLRKSRERRRARSLSAQLKAFLDGPSVCERTDDDKTLILARYGRET